MEFSYDSPLNGIKVWNKPIFDTHIHIWKPDHYKLFVKWANIYYGKKMSNFYCLGMAEPKVKKEIPEIFAQNIVFAYYMDVKAFVKFDIKKLLEEIDIARKHEYPMLKIWFAPRMIDYGKGENGYRINDQRFDKIFEKIEDYRFKVIIHVADPDLWFNNKYYPDRHGTKKSRINDFCDIMDKFSKIQFISAHLGCWPENLTKLGDMLEKYPQLYYDTGSTRWLIRELGKNVTESNEWFTKYSKRILFGSDLSVTEKVNPEYFATRYWSHKIFWETSQIGTVLPFRDADNPFGTKINGLNLNKNVLEDIYFKNAKQIFGLN